MACEGIYIALRWNEFGGLHHSNLTEKMKTGETDKNCVPIGQEMISLASKFNLYKKDVSEFCGERVAMASMCLGCLLS